MAVILPLITTALLFVYLGNRWPAWKWGQAFIRSVILAGTYAVVTLELLSLVQAVTRISLIFTWLLPGLFFGAWILRRFRSQSVLRLPKFENPESPGIWVMIAGIVGVLLLTAIVAWFTPPQTWDSLTYHTARVAHWAQNQSVAHYPSGIPRQNLMSPGAEMLVLEAYVLGQGDRFANFVEWSAMLVSLAAVYHVATQLGASQSGRWFAAIFAATLPMGISQASSAMTDYVVAVWMICVASEALMFRLREGTLTTSFFIGLAAGLAILAKPIAFPYLLPFAIFVGGVLLRKGDWKVLVAALAVALFAVAVTNAGYFSRNTVTYGNPLGSNQKVYKHSNKVLNLNVVFSNVLRNASLHMGTPWEQVNHQIFRGIVGLHVKMGLDVNDPRTTVHPYFDIYAPIPDETRSGNPIHALIIVLSTIVLAFVWRRRGEAQPLWMMLLALSGFFLLSITIRFTLFGSRYHLPFFILAAPAVGYLVGINPIRRAAPVLGIGLVVAAWPWLTALQSRPLLRDPDRAGGESVLLEERDKLYFAFAPGQYEHLQNVVHMLSENSCRSLGVMFSGDAPEYPLWAYMNAPSDDLTIRWLVAGDPSARYVQGEFEPCGVVCDQSCPPDWTEVRGLPLFYSSGHLRLYLNPPE
jgi:hypothetical protein